MMSDHNISALLAFESMAKAKAKSAPGDLARNIRRYRLEKGLSQARLRDLTSVSSIAMIESGKIRSPREDNIDAIAKVLGVTVSQLWQPPPPPIDTSKLPKPLQDFLNSPECRSEKTPPTDDEIRHLLAMNPRGKRPTKDAYYFGFKYLRALDDDAEE